jgi:hypothetical protein
VALLESKCEEIAEWSLRQRIPGVPDVRAIVDADQTRGVPSLDAERREARFHPDDFLLLQRWGWRKERELWSHG